MQQPTTPNVQAKTQEVADKAEQALDATRRAAGDAMGRAQEALDSARTRVPEAFSDAAHRMEELARDGIHRAREFGHDVRERAHRAGDSTVTYIRDEPVKSVLIAAAVGAAIATVASLLARSRSDR
ncbi:MAG: hypothetical protein LCH73_00380 [Proteobacteria bacterium]|nr:hypothetical protein [Pseudomonadota bacterium]